LYALAGIYSNNTISGFLYPVSFKNPDTLSNLVYSISHFCNKRNENFAGKALNGFFIAGKQPKGFIVDDMIKDYLNDHKAVWYYLTKGE
jgi:hypothetical protein